MKISVPNRIKEQVGTISSVHVCDRADLELEYKMNMEVDTSTIVQAQEPEMFTSSFAAVKDILATLTMKRMERENRNTDL